MTTLGMIVSTLMIIVGANAAAASQSCQDTSLKRQVVHYASSLTRGYYAKWNEVSCTSAPDSGALVFSIRHVVSEYHDKNGNLYRRSLTLIESRWTKLEILIPIVRHSGVNMKMGRSIKDNELVHLARNESASANGKALVVHSRATKDKPLIVLVKK